jgi:hypothetical protein
MTQLIKEAKRFQELAGLKEVKIQPSIPNNLNKLEQIKTQINQTKDKATKIALAIKVAELVLPIWEYYYPKNDRPRKAIEAAKSGNSADVYNMNDVAYEAYEAHTYAAASAAYAIYAASSTNAVNNAVNNAIKATKEHFKMN